MSVENETPIESFDDDLDKFSSTFFGQKEDEHEDTTKSEAEPVDDVKEDADVTENVETHDDVDEDEDDLEEEKPQPKKNRFQERINQKTREAAELARERDELREKLAELSKPEPTPEKSGPEPTDMNEDGTDKYPLGEFDPSYIRDLTKHALKEERETLRQEAQREKEDAEATAYKTELNQRWSEKLTPAQERYPDFHEKGENLSPVFEKIDGKYSEYLAATIMDMDYGPDVLYYLANNTDEAEKIISMGPTKATVALGRLESKFSIAEEEKTKARKISNAPTPPQHTARGTAVAKPEIDDDTDDLDAFAKKFFKKRRS